MGEMFSFRTHARRRRKLIDLIRPGVINCGKYATPSPTDAKLISPKSLCRIDDRHVCVECGL